MKGWLSCSSSSSSTTYLLVTLHQCGIAPTVSPPPHPAKHPRQLLQLKLTEMTREARREKTRVQEQLIQSSHICIFPTTKKEVKCDWPRKIWRLGGFESRVAVGMTAILSQ